MWLDPTIIPDTRLVTFRRDDDVFGGILQSRHHEVWSLRFGGNHGVGNDPEYIHTSTFETFPFPSDLEPNVPVSEFEESGVRKKIAEAFAALHELREAWLNPPELVRRIADVSGFPDRLVPVDDAAAAILKQRTMTNLYNQRPNWLVSASRRLDEAVAEAYGHPADLSSEEILERLYALNRERAAD